MEDISRREDCCCRRSVQHDLPLRRETRNRPSDCEFSERRSGLHVQMPVRRTHLEGLGYPSRSYPLFLPQIAACVRF